MPFYVIDHAKWPDEEKLAWIRQEIGDNADLSDFVEKWLNLFGEKLRGAMSQKAACLKLYGQYAPQGAEARAWKKESDLSPDMLEQFQRMWDKTAPERCRECGKAAAPGRWHPVRRLGKAFCSAQCAAAGTVFSCSKCNEPVSTEQPHCATCKWGLPEPAPARRSQQRSRLDDVI